MTFPKLLLAGVCASALVFAQGQPKTQLPGTPTPSNPSTPGRTTTSSTSNMVNAADQEFMKKVHDVSHKEVELGKLAVRNASDPGVKAFGQRMIDDHTKAGRELDQLARRKGVSFNKMTVDAGNLKGMKGADFDREYMKMMVEGHQEVVSDFERQEKETSDPDLRAFISQTLPTVKSHLEQAKSLNK